MPKFGSPFSGLANDRKLTDEELIRAVRFMIAAEFEATQLYMQLAESTDNKLAIAVLRDIASAGFAVLVPAGTHHNIINTGSAPLKLYTLYAPPNHRDGVVHHTGAAAEAGSEHFYNNTAE